MCACANVERACACACACVAAVHLCTRACAFARACERASVHACVCVRGVERVCARTCVNTKIHACVHAYTHHRTIEPSNKETSLYTQFTSCNQLDVCVEREAQVKCNVNLVVSHKCTQAPSLCMHYLWAKFICILSEGRHEILLYKFQV